MKNIELKLGSLNNKGDMLMFFAIVNQFAKKHRLYCGRSHRYLINNICQDKIHSYFQLESSQNYSLWQGEQIKETWNKLLFKIIPKIIPTELFLFWKDLIPIIPESKIDILLDASGYAYGDTWGVKKIERSILKYNSLKNAKKIMMPQSFGPFEKNNVAKVFQELASLTDIIYARDSISFTNLRSVIPNHPGLRQAPDFTFDVESFKPTFLESPANYVCIIPSHRLITHFGKQEKDTYLNYLYTCINSAEKMGYSTVIVAHDYKHDIEVCNALNQSLGKELLVFTHHDVRYIRWVIGNSKLTISSRFHGLINALTQCVPSISIGWTHKFECIMKEYGLERYITNLDTPRNKVDQLVFELLDETKRREIIETLTVNRAEQIKQANQMWNDINKIISDHN